VSQATEEIVDYDRLAAIFQDSLTTKLRGNVPKEKYLELWVPDADPVTGLLNMVDAAFEAGRRSITIRVSHKILPKDRWAQLRALGLGLGGFALEDTGDALIIRSSATTAFTAQTDESARDAGAKSKIWAGVVGAPKLSADQKYVHEQLLALQAAQGEGRDPVTIDLSVAPSATAADKLKARIAEYGSVVISGSTASVTIDPALKPVADLAPAFRRRALAASTKILREGEPRAGSGEIILDAEIDGVRLAVSVETDKQRVIRQARHRGATKVSERVCIDMFCALMEGLPIQEAAEHAGQKLLDALREKGTPRPVRGIMGFRNTGAAFNRPVELARAIYRAYAEKTGFQPPINFYEAPPSQTWMQLSKEEQQRRIQNCLAEFLRGIGRSDEDMQLESLQLNTKRFPVRVFILYSKSVAYLDKPALMMAFERKLKDTVELRLQVYNQEMSDKSPLRRL